MGKFTDIFDSFFSEPKEKPHTVSIHAIIRRKSCVVRVGGRFYRVTAVEIPAPEKKQEPL